MIEDCNVVDVIRAWFDYDAENGVVRWKQWVSPDWYQHKSYHTKFLKERAGKIVKFHQGPDGYLKVRVRKIPVICTHRIVWVLVHGKLPDYVIDHIDGDPSNNKIENLRDVPQELNVRNRRVPFTNTSGVMGVSWHKCSSKWRAHVTLDGKQRDLGFYDTLDEAAQARRDALEANKHLGYTARHCQQSEIT